MSDQLILNVSQVNTYIKETLDADDLLSSICIRGELSNYKRYPSGHHYFTLKDEESSLKCVMFRSSAMRLRFRPENGMQVIATGRISVYPRDGAYQLYCIAMLPEGSGDLSVAFEQLRKKLGAEGLFDESAKKPLPAFPHRIALVTSAAGAAVHDMLTILNRRWPLSEVLVVPVRVQGSEAAGEIADAIACVNRYKLADLIITGRGGGSLEDLWAFNEEIVARAIYRSVIPVISAVGHEPDVTISDYVADKRAATPSNAAELAVPDRQEIMAFLRQCDARMAASLQKQVRLQRQRLNAAAGARVLLSPAGYLDQHRQHLDQQMARMTQAFSAAVQTQRSRIAYYEKVLPADISGYTAGKRAMLTARAAKLDAMSPLKVLLRGYSIVSAEDGTVVTDAARLQPGDRIQIRFAAGSAQAKIIEESEKA